MYKYGKYWGHWWIPSPNNNNKRVSGILEISEDSFELTVLENFEGEYQRIENPRSQDGLPLIVGYAKLNGENKDEAFTLVNSKLVAYKKNYLTEATYTSQQLIKGRIYSNIDEIKVSMLFLKFQFFDAWVGESGFENSSDITPRIKGTYSSVIKYIQPKIPVIFSDEKSKLGIFVRAKTNHAILPFSMKASIEQSIYLNIEYFSKKGLDAIFSEVENYRNLYSLFVGYPVRLLNVGFCIESEQYYIDNSSVSRTATTLYIKNLGMNYFSNNLDKGQMILPFSLIKGNSNKIITAWNDKSNRLSIPLNLYFSTIYNMDLESESVLLNLVFACEILHKKLSVDSEDNSVKLSKMEDKILKKLEQNEREWLRKRLRKKNNKTLISRFLELIDCYPFLFKMITKDSELFVKKVVTTRNYFAHYHAFDKSFLIELEDLYSYNKRLEILLNGIFLIEIGVEKDVIEERLLKPTHYRLICE